MEKLQTRVVVDGIVYPEGIRWFAGKVWFSDILDSCVYSFDPRTGRREVAVDLDDRPSGLGFLPDGRLLVAVMGGRKLLRLDPGGPSVLADLSGLCSMVNDMVTDASGRSYVDAHFESESEGGGIILVEPDGGFRVVAEGLNTPNGMAVSADGKRLVVNDLFGNRIYTFDIGEDGSLSGRKLFADLGDCSPDGLCLDSEGGAWVGLPFQNRFRRILEGGEVTHEIDCTGRWGIAPVLGGEGRRTLFLATAEVTLEAMPRLIADPTNARDECRGWIEAVGDAPAPGAGWP